MHYTLYTNWLWFITAQVYSVGKYYIKRYKANWPYLLTTKAIYSHATLWYTFIKRCLFVSVCGATVNFMVLFKYGYNRWILIFLLIVSWWLLGNGVLVVVVKGNVVGSSSILWEVHVFVEVSRFIPHITVKVERI